MQLPTTNGTWYHKIFKKHTLYLVLKATLRSGYQKIVCAIFVRHIKKPRWIQLTVVSNLCTCLPACLPAYLHIYLYRYSSRDRCTSNKKSKWFCQERYFLQFINWLRSDFLSQNHYPYSLCYLQLKFEFWAYNVKYILDLPHWNLPAFALSGNIS